MLEDDPKDQTATYIYQLSVWGQLSYGHARTVNHYFFNRFSKVWTTFSMQFLYQIQLANSLIIVTVSVHTVLWSVLQINITWNFTQKNQELLKISNLFTLIIDGAFESLLSRVCVKQETWKDERILTLFFSCFIPIITGQLSVIFLLLTDLIKHRLKLSSFLPWFSSHVTTQLSPFDSSMPLFWHRKDSLWILVRTIAHRESAKHIL